MNKNRRPLRLSITKYSTLQGEAGIESSLGAVLEKCYDFGRKSASFVRRQRRMMKEKDSGLNWHQKRSSEEKKSKWSRIILTLIRAAGWQLDSR